jgi:hypothetical protein
MWKQIGGIAALVMSVIMLIIFSVCLYYVLSYRQPIIDVVGTLLEQADTALSVAVTGAGTAVTLTGEAQALVDDTQATLTAAAAEVSERKEELVNDAKAAFGQRFGTQLSTALATVQGVADSVRAAQELAAAMNRIPGVEFEIPGTNVMTEISQKAQEIEATAQETRSKVEQVTALPGEAIDTANAGLSELSQKIGEIKATLANIDDTVMGTQEAVRALQQEYVGTINLVAILLSIILVWAIISQIIVMRWAWTLMRQEEPAQAA